MGVAKNQLEIINNDDRLVNRALLDQSDPEFIKLLGRYP